MIYIILLAIISAICFVVGGILFAEDRGFSAMMFFIGGGICIYLAILLSFKEGEIHFLDTSICPVCQESYEKNYEYCPIDGAKLELSFKAIE